MAKKKKNNKGKKQNNDQKSIPVVKNPSQIIPVRKIIGVIFIISIAGIAWHLFSQENQQKRLKKEFKNTLDKYESLHLKDTWWMKESPQSLDDVNMYRLTKTKRDMRRMLRKHKDLNPITKRMSDSFCSVVLSSNMVITTESMHIKDGTLHLCFFAKDKQRDHPATFYFEKRFRAVMCGSVSVPKKVLFAIVVHEMGHMFAFEDGKPSATAPVNSDAYIREEVDMHRVEMEVLNNLTDGKYNALVQKIIKDKECFITACYSISIEHLKEMDQILEIENCGKEVASMMFAQLIMSVGLQHIDAQYPSDSKLMKLRKAKEEILLYRFVRSMHK